MVTMPPCSATQPRILIAEDQPDLIDALRLLLKGAGIDASAVSSPEAALAAVSTGSFDLLLMDLNYTGDTTSGREGIDLLSQVQAISTTLARARSSASRRCRRSTAISRLW